MLDTQQELTKYLLNDFYLTTNYMKMLPNFSRDIFGSNPKPSLIFIQLLQFPGIILVAFPSELCCHFPPRSSGIHYRQSSQNYTCSNHLQLFPLLLFLLLFFLSFSFFFLFLSFLSLSVRPSLPLFLQSTQVTSQKLKKNYLQ